MTQPATETIDSEDGHAITLTVGEHEHEHAEAGCEGCDWTGQGWVVGLRSLSRNHADGTDGSR